jgi:hypothetical protein
LASEASRTEFQTYLKLLNLIANAWEINQKVNLDGFLNVSQENIKITHKTQELVLNKPEELVIKELSILPPRIPKKGLPKGNDKAAIGFPKKEKLFQ